MRVIPDRRLHDQLLYWRCRRFANLASAWQHGGWAGVCLAGATIAWLTYWSGGEVFIVRKPQIKNQQPFSWLYTYKGVKKPISL